MSNATETRQRDKHGANRQDGTDDEYDPLSATPDETTPANRPQASEQAETPATPSSQPPAHPPTRRAGDNMRIADEGEPARGGMAKGKE